MSRVLLLTFAIITYAFPDTISLSKDSLKVKTDLLDASVDQLILINTSDESVSLDSAYFLVDVFDTTGMSGKPELHWVEEQYGDFGWYLHEIGQNTYRLEKKFFSPRDTAVPLRLFPMDSCIVLDLQIGYRLVSEYVPLYPKCVQGSLQLFFSNKQTVTVRLYSDDLQTKTARGIRAHRRIETACSHGYLLLNGKRTMNKKVRGVAVLELKGAAGAAAGALNSDGRHLRSIRVHRD